MTTNQQNAVVSQPQTVVVKLGTSVLTGGTLALDRAHMVELARQCAELKKQGHSVVMVSSGAIAAGREHLGYPALPNEMASKQLLAAVGQSRLIQTWESLFGIYGIKIGQMLLTRADLDDRERFLNARDTINALVANDIIPIVNENDAVATSEIKVGDNDNLSALVGILCGADKLLLLTDQKGLFTADPRKDPNAELIKEVKTIDDTLRKIAGGSGTTLGTGGMATKLQAADIARRAGIEVIIAAGSAPNVIFDSLTTEPQGTRFLPCSEALENRKRWILAGPAASGDIIIDDGAVNAVVGKGSSLLAKGVIKVSGDFARGEVARVTNSHGKLVARGISAYSSEDLAKITGKHSKDIISILGHDYGSEVIHRDDLVVIQE
ncbi:glutamate 5-kinase [Vibrio parahaemolyticus]|uniref:glutamate 5-kinase n=1 Tax=Vibrio parahaemolyticus TaxID=670 RepID=UPI0004089A5F|nr:glutamate 5-kinase [Vibrio parahaemolyticus]MBE4803411.1 glutamate 5-kinase [Vibrio parahaemolyticus]TOO80101.1 glutamate 5-kinase [Vibrio parahaemolyticus]HCG5264677.1 glutamate 5-kinase [Vibrio parahaemolyticus]HCG5266395.1 glutamate 5-kinase [Vibrio parahaemolyticus]HCG5536842.1 glutamate 5-kinase [Vibrio parahaemolyticus]